MKKAITSAVLCAALSIHLMDASAAAPQRWMFDVVDAQTNSVVGSAGIVALVDNRPVPAIVHYSFQVTSKALTSGGYRARLEVNGIHKVVDFSPEPNGGVRVRVDSMLTLPLYTVLAPVPSVEVYSGEHLVYRGVLKGGDSTSVPAAGMGGLSGNCGVMTSAVIAAPAPYFFRNTLDFWGDPYDPADFSRLSTGAQAILSNAITPTSAVLARAFAFEVLRRCEGAQLLKTVDEIRYLDASVKKADMLVEISGSRIGVTSTRAFKYPPDYPFTLEDARVLLERKLDDVLYSGQHVAAADRWAKHVLHVFAYTSQHADSLAAAYVGIDPVLKANTVLLITVTEGADIPLYQ